MNTFQRNKHILLVVTLLVAVASKLSICDIAETARHDDEDILESPLCCNLTTTEKVEVEYSSKVVENEYIVTFNGYYKSQARASYITAALNNSGVHHWRILARENPASDYPSDFDVVIIEDTQKLEGR